MAELFGGYGRKVLVNTAGTIAEAGSADFGVLYAGQFPRLTGIAVVDSIANNSASIQFNFQGYSGATLTTSALAIASGGSHFNVTNEGNYVGLSITPADSETTFSCIVFGELAR